MRPDNMVETMNAIVLSGGSAYGLAAASGVMRCLEAQGIGFPVGGPNVVPIVPAAVSFDRASCKGRARRDPTLSPSDLQACLERRRRRTCSSRATSARARARCRAA